MFRQDGGAGLAKVNAVKIRLLRKDGPAAPAPRVVCRPPPIAATVTDVLEAASTDLRTTEVRSLVEQRLGEPVSWSSVRNALADLAADAEQRVQRVAYGRHRLTGRNP